jgi:Tol biopolymer transport system component
MYDPGGYLVFSRSMRNKGVWAVPFSLERMATTGEPFLVDPEGDWPSVSLENTLVYTRGAGGAQRQLAIVDRQGALVATVGSPQTGMDGTALSWDGTRALVSAVESESRDIWMHDIERGTATRVTFEAGHAFGPAWLPGDRRIAFNLGTGPSDLSISSAPADGTGEATRIIESGQNVSYRPGVPFAAFSRISEATAWDVYRVPLGEDGLPDGDPVPIIAGPKNDYDIQISPGGDYIAYASRESGTEQIYVKTFPGGEGKWQVAGRESYWPRWSRKGDELYFIQPQGSGTALMAVKVEKSPVLRLSTPVLLFDEKQHPEIVLDADGRTYDVFPDGERFLVLRVPEGVTTESPRLVVSQRWAAAFDGSAKR